MMYIVFKETMLDLKDIMISSRVTNLVVVISVFLYLLQGRVLKWKDGLVGVFSMHAEECLSVTAGQYMM